MMKKLVLTGFLVAIVFINQFINNALAYDFKKDIIESDYKQSIIDYGIPKIEYSFSCNSKWGSVSDITPTEILLEDNTIRVKGHYKQSLFIKGGEFNRMSGVFTALFDSNIKLLKLYYKVSLKKGEIQNECID